MNYFEDRTLLFADGNMAIESSFRKNLERDGHNILTAFTIEEALQIIRENLPDYVFVGDNFADGSGPEFLSRLKAERPEIFEQIQFLFLTENAFTVRNDERCTGIPVIRKPVKLRQLRRLIC